MNQFSRHGVTRSGSSSSSKRSYQDMSGASFLSSSGMDAVTATMQYGMNARRRIADDDDGLEDGDEELEYIPAADSPTNAGAGGDDEYEEDDPLDAYMAQIEVKAKKDKETSEKKAKEDPIATAEKDYSKSKLGRADIEELDDEETYYNWMTEQAQKAKTEDEEDEFEYDEEGRPMLKKKYIDPLPRIDHSSITYEPFERNFYVEHDEIKSLEPEEVDQLRQKLGIKVFGANVPKPVCSFAHFGFDSNLMDIIRKSDYSTPTPIQAQGIPVAMSGRDIIGVAKTGSGKTAAYIWPAIMHILDQKELVSGDGPIALICVPTRELALQVYNETRRFCKVYNIGTICAYGGGSKWEQSKALQSGAEIIVCTPGRLIDHVKINATNLGRVTYLVIDEADRMFDLGFEAQVRSIADHVRPERQCLLFSATFKKKVERLARDILTDPIKVVQGEIGEANEDIRQIVEVLDSESQKWPWLIEHLVGFTTVGKVLIFVSRKLDAEELAKNLKLRDLDVSLLHGDLLQLERTEVLQNFRKNDSCRILVSTDVAARGLDIPTIKTVINYDVARDGDTHIHRIGRTGRAGEIGYAYTLVTEKDKEYAGHIVRSLESVNQGVSPKLMDIALKAAWFRKNRFKSGKGKKPNIGGRGLGYQDTDPGPSVERRGFEATSAGIKEAVNSMKNSSDRASAMRAAFTAQYSNAFHGASSDTSWDSHRVEITDPTPEWKHVLKQLKENVNRLQAAQGSSQGSNSETSSSSHKEGPSKNDDGSRTRDRDRTRRSRWD